MVAQCAKNMMKGRDTVQAYRILPKIPKGPIELCYSIVKVTLRGGFVSESINREYRSSMLAFVDAEKTRISNEYESMCNVPFVRPVVPPREAGALFVFFTPAPQTA